MPIIVSIENRERNSVVVELVGFEFANHVVQAVGNTLCTSQSFLADIVVIVVELLNLILKFLFILFSLSQFFFYLLVLSSQSIEMLFVTICAGLLFVSFFFALRSDLSRDI